MAKNAESIALCAVIVPITTAIRAEGQEGETVRLMLDIYEKPEVIQTLMELSGQEFK